MNWILFVVWLVGGALLFGGCLRHIEKTVRDEPVATVIVCCLWPLVLLALFGWKVSKRVTTG